MIRVAGQYGRRPIKLFGDDDLGQAVRQSYGTERKRARRLFAEFVTVTVGPTQHKGNCRSTLIPQLAEQPRKRLACQRLALLVDSDNDGLLGDACDEVPSLFGLALRRARLARFAHGNFAQRSQRDRLSDPANAPRIVIVKRALGSRFEFAD